MTQTKEMAFFSPGKKLFFFCHSHFVIVRNVFFFLCFFIALQQIPRIPRAINQRESTSKKKFLNAKVCFATRPKEQREKKNYCLLVSNNKS
jgi:hypothetical protein